MCPCENMSWYIHGTLINSRHMRRRVTVVVVVWSVRVCVTTNLGIHAEWCQVMGTSGISGVWRSFAFSLKTRRSKVMA